MKVLMINGSPNKDGCTKTALDIIATTLKENDIESEIYQVGNKQIRGCIGCRKCVEKGKCIFDDCVNEVAEKLKEYDGLILGSPVYYASANGTLISFLDRLFYSTSSIDKTMKVGAAIVSARRAGTTTSLDELNKYFSISNMPIVSSQYWNMVHGNSKEDVLKDKEGCQIMNTLGKNMAFLIKSIQLGKENFGLPQKEEIVRTNFIQ